MSSHAAVQTTHRGKSFTVEIVEYRDADGGVHTREVVRHPGVVLVVPVLTDTSASGSQHSIVMIRNYRVATDETLWELPAGKLERGEDPESAAARELEEETGYRAGRIRKLGEFYTSPGFADELMRAFVAEDLTQAKQRLEPGEQIEVEVVPLDRAIEMATNGTLRDGKSIAALLMWEQERNRR